MRYDDASHTGSTEHSGPVARPDVENLPAGSYGPASGNAITGAGTASGAAGADQGGASIVEVHGAGGQTVEANGAFQANGQYGILSMTAQGDFQYVRNPGTPDGVKDVFNYTVADANGATASTTITVDVGQTAAAAALQNVVALPAGVELSDIHVNGRDLVINMPDGTQMVIPGGAVFVPELTIGDVQVPPSNLAALLIDSEPKPAAGPNQLSSGGNFADPVPPLDPGAPLGDLIPPTVLPYQPPEFQQLADAVAEKPTVVIVTPDDPAGVVDAQESVFEKGLPTRNGGEPAGSGEIADGNGSNNSDPSESNIGTIVFDAPGGFKGITVDGVEVTAVGQQIQGQYGVMTITGINIPAGQITYSYTLTDNTSGDNTQDVFTVVVTDDNNKTATGSLTVHIIDDVPTAHNDTDALDQNHTATGNVITGEGTTSGASGADIVGADNASLTAVSSNSSGQSDTSFDSSGNLVVHGEFGTLTIKADGSYVYTLDSNTHGGGNDVFTYTLTDGDGDTTQATLTITVPVEDIPPSASNSSVNVSEEGLPGGNPDNTGNPDTTNSATASGSINPADANGDALTITLGVPAGSYTSHGEAVNWSVSADGHTLIGYIGSDPTVTANQVVVVTINNSGQYNVTLLQPFDDPNTSTEDSINFVVPATVNDGFGGTTVANITVTVEDDSPIARNDTDSLDSNHTATGNVVTGVGTTSGSAGADSYGADGPGGVVGVSSNSTGQSDTTFDQSGNLVVHGQFGTLTLHADGSYTYTLDQGAQGGANDVFTYTIVDGDGDKSNATLTINVPLQNLPPTAQDSSVNVSEEGLVGGNPDSNGSPDTTNSASGTGQIVASDPNGDALTMTLSDQISGSYTSGGNAVAWTLAQNGQELIGYIAGTDPTVAANQVITVTIQNDGTYTVQLLQPFDDPNTNAEDSIKFDVPVTVSDGHGGTASADITVTVEDDSPTVSAHVNTNAAVTVDESGPVPASASVALGGYTAGNDPDVAGAGPIASASTGVLDIVNPGVSYGADGPGSTSYSLVVENATSGLTTTDGSAINLILSSDGTIVGVVQGGTFDGQVAFAIGINSATGQVTIDQYLSLNNPDATDPNDPVHLDNGTVGVVVTATDADGDHVSSPAVDVSGQFTFLDDGPQFTSIHASSATVTVDESGPVPASATVALGTGNVGGNDPDVSGSGPIASGNSGGASMITATIDYGADGKGTNPSYSLVVENATSGLTTTDGHAINLVLTDAGTIVGIVSGGTFDGEVAFAVGINSSTGAVTIDQYLSLHNPDATDPNDPVHLNNGTIGVVISATDGDGDPVSNSASPVDISGQFTFLDDGPSAGADTNSTSAGQTITVTAGSNSDVLHNDLPGADGYASGGGVVGVATGSDTSAALSTGVGDVIHGTYGDLTLNADGSYTYVAKANVSGTDHFVYTIQDGDGDTSTTTLDITVGKVTAAVGSDTTYVSEEVLPTVGTERNGDNDSDSTHDVLTNSGDISLTDSIAGATFTTALTAPVGTYTSGGTTIVWTPSNGGHTMTGTAGGNTVIVATIDNTGHYTVTLSGPIDTPNGVNAGENGGDSIITFGVTATDNFGNTLTNGSLTVHVEDDAPVAALSGNGVGTAILDESAVGTDTPGGIAPVGLASTTINLAAGFATPVYGADGPGSTTYALHLNGTNVASGLYALDPSDESTADGDGYGQGQQIVLNQSGNVITGSVGGTTYFTITINPTTGVATFTQVNNIWHPVAGSSGAALDDTATLNTNLASALQVTQTITDHDNDTATATINLGQGVFKIEDSGPQISNVDATLQVTNSGAHPSGTGAFAFNIGTDVNSVTHNDFTNVTFSATVAGNAVTNAAISETSETATTATYSFSFDYPNGGGTDHETGTLTFDKTNGTYTVTLDHPIQNFTILDTAGASAANFTNYDLGASTTSNSPTGVAEVQLASNFWIQFSGVYDKTGQDHLTTTQGTAGSYNQVTAANSIGSLDLFTQANATVTISNTAAGVAGNTIQGGEVLDFNLYSTNQQGFLGNTPDQTASSMFIVLNGIGTSEDMIVIVKLYDTSTGKYSEQALMVQNSDIIKSNATLANTAYSGIVLGSTDGVVIIEPNDYQNGNTNLVIVGAQIAGSDDGITGQAVNFNGNIGASGGSDFVNTQSFQTDVSDSPFKVTDIGFLTQTSTAQAGQLNFGVTLTDADGDTATQNLTVDVGTQAPAPINPAATTMSVNTASVNTTSLVSSNDNHHAHQNLRSAEGGHNAALMAAIAAAGVAGLDTAAAAHTASHGFDRGIDLSALRSTVVPQSTAGDGGHATHDSVSTTQPTVVTSNASGAPSHGHHGQGEVDHSPKLHHDGGRQDALSSLDHGTHGPAHSDAGASHIMAPAILMPSAQQLLAAGHGQASVEGKGAEHNAVVGKVLADALHGGEGHAPNIDALVSNLAGHDGPKGAQAALEALASHGPHAVPMGHSAFAGLFGGQHSMPMETHHDAAPAHG